MGERCRCGAELLPRLHFCVACGAVRGAGPGGPGQSPPRPIGGGHRPPGQFPPSDRFHLPEQRRPAGPFGPERSGGPAQFGGVRQPGGVRHSESRQFEARQFGEARSFGEARPFDGSPGYGGMARFGEPPFGTARPAVAAPRPAVPGWLIAVSVFLVVLLGTGAVVVALRPALLSSVSAASVAPAAAPTTTAASPFVPEAPSSVAAAPTASGELAAQVDRDRPRAEPAAGYWVPQLSSKRPGTVDRGVRYDDASILGHYRGLAARHPDAALLWSGDWPVFAGSDYWVVIDAEPFATAAQANAWCDAQGLGPDDCLAKHLSHSGGPAGTTVHR